MCCCNSLNPTARLAASRSLPASSRTLEVAAEPGAQDPWHARTQRHVSPPCAQQMRFNTTAAAPAIDKCKRAASRSYIDGRQMDGPHVCARANSTRILIRSAPAYYVYVRAGSTRRRPPPRKTVRTTQVGRSIASPTPPQLDMEIQYFFFFLCPQQ